MKKKSHRRLKANERPARIPAMKVVLDKKTKAKKRNVIKQDTRKAIQEN